jgi:hypothetical protein
VIDLTGSVLVRTRDHPPIQSICASRVGTEDRGKAWRAPMVICVDEGVSRSPGAGRAANTRIGLQLHTFAFRCYGQDRAQAAQLAHLVSDLWHECGTVEGTGDPPDLIAKPIEDAGLKRPYATCYVDVLGGAEPKGVSS